MERQARFRAALASLGGNDFARFTPSLLRDAAEALDTVLEHSPHVVLHTDLAAHLTVRTWWHGQARGRRSIAMRAGRRRC
jgi:hypothetical protein